MEKVHMSRSANLANTHKLLAAVLILSASSALHCQTRGDVSPPQDPAKPRPVRNNVPQSGEGIITIRYFHIKKGTFNQFLEARQDVEPYFEKVGARSIGVWKVIQAEGVEGQTKPNNDYDEVYMATRYASIDHWKATRDPTSLGGNGPDWEKCQRGLALLQGLTISTNVIFLKGAMAANQPLFMPGLNEAYEKKP
jgi:hypothetical protein